MRIGLTSVFVDDQDQAEQFYTQVLGFQVKTNAPYGDTKRWLAVVSPEEPEGWSWCCTWPTSRPGPSRRPAARSGGRCCRCAPTTVPPMPSG
jgi:catechol 2,3-dioxygenase-like lactoylglutathione lyase family enzyme